MFGAVIGGLLTVLYILKMRRRRITVPFSPLWAKVLMQKQAADWLQRLKRLLSLALQLAIVAVLLIALMNPQPEAEIIRGRSFAVVLDISASMSAVEPAQGGKTRWDIAKEKAQAIISDLGPTDKMILIAVDGQIRSVTGDFTSDKAALTAGLEALAPTATEARILDALSTAADALADRPDPSLILISDAAHPRLPSLPVQLLQPQVAFRHEVVAALPVSPADATTTPEDAPIIGNISLSGFNIRRYLSNKTDYELFVQIQNHFEQPVCVQLGIYNVISDPQLKADVEKLIALDPPKEPSPCEPTTPGHLAFEVLPKDHLLRLYPNLSASRDRILARVTLARRTDASAPQHARLIDTLHMDDTAYVIVPQTQKIKILAVTGDNLFLRAVLLHNDNVSSEMISPEEATPERILSENADVVIFDNSTPQNPDSTSKIPSDTVIISPTPPGPGNYLYINPRGADSPFIARSINDKVLINTINRRHPMARWLALRDINTLRGAVLSINKTKTKDANPLNETVASAPEGPVIITSRQKNAGINLVGVGFSLTESDIVMRFALPILFINAFDWFMDDGGSLIQGYRTGVSWHIPVPQELSRADIRRPDGTIERDIPIHERELVYYGALPGFYTISPAAPPDQPNLPPLASQTTTIAANFASWAESQLSPATPYPPKTAATVPSTEQPQTNIFDGWAWIFDRLSRFDVWIYCVLTALSLLVIEWFTYHRRHTV